MLTRTIQEIYFDAIKDQEEALTELLFRLQPLIISSIRKYYNRKEEMDDLIQEGRLLILESVENYSKDYSVPFLGYIKSRLKYLYLGKNRIKKVVSLNVSIGEEGVEHINMLQDDFCLEEDYVRNEEKSGILLKIEMLPKRERQVVKSYYYGNLSISEIANKYGISYRTVINTKKRALERLKKEMEDKNV